MFTVGGYLFAINLKLILFISSRLKYLRFYTAVLHKIDTIFIILQTCSNLKRDSKDLCDLTRERIIGRIPNKCNESKVTSPMQFSEKTLQIKYLLIKNPTKIIRTSEKVIQNNVILFSYNKRTCSRKCIHETDNYKELPSDMNDRKD